MKKPYYIVPDVKNHYDYVEADDEQKALELFANIMDTDISAYFKAVDKKPVQYPHGYECPEGKFQLAMSIIVATMTDDKENAYYKPDGLGDDVTLCRMDAVAKLQEAYDILKESSPSAAYLARGKFFKILKLLTGFTFKKKKKPHDNDILRIYVGNELKIACKVLMMHNIPYDVDNGDRLMIERRHFKEAFKTLENAGVDADVM